MNRRLGVALLIAAVWYRPATARAQDAVPTEILSRTIFIKVGNEAGTAFTIDHQGKIYLVTARHVVTDVPDKDAIIQINKGGQWQDYYTVKTLYPSSSDVDIAVFETAEKATRPFDIAPAGDTGGVSLGQQLWFIGYPFGLASHVTIKGSGSVVLPFIKRGTMSAIDATNPDAVVYYIDGFNNRGFSGGPILFWKFSTHTYKILGVVKGYRNDTAQLLVNGQQVDTNILVNSGILIGYSIDLAIQAIDQSLKTQP
ncbi:MAG: serine protease [Stellaceae bacterium]